LSDEAKFNGMSFLNDNLVQIRDRIKLNKKQFENKSLVQLAEEPEDSDEISLSSLAKQARQEKDAQKEEDDSQKEEAMFFDFKVNSFL
jgi:hypothetical protein